MASACPDARLAEELAREGWEAALTPDEQQASTMRVLAPLLAMASDDERTRRALELGLAGSWFLGGARPENLLLEVMGKVEQRGRAAVRALAERLESRLARCHAWLYFAFGEGPSADPEQERALIDELQRTWCDAAESDKGAIAAVQQRARPA